MSKLGIELGSKAMWGSHCYHAPSRTLFDCGVGTLQHLESRIFAVERICLSHSDFDHWTDLVPFVGLRAHTKGATSKPLVVYYPNGDSRLEEAIRFIRRATGRLSYTLTFEPLPPDLTFKVDQTHSITTFPMRHREGLNVLGYKVVETRKRLNPHWRARVDAALAAHEDVGGLLVAARRAGEVTDDTYSSTVFSYTLDHWSFDYEHVRDAALVVSDCTFLHAADRDDLTHATLDEAARWCKGVGVKHMVAAHLSTRYHPVKVREAVARVSIELDLPITLCETDTLLVL